MSTGLENVRARMREACKEAGRDVTLIAVSKTHGVDEIVPVIDEGQLVFGENRVQEAQAKWPDLRARYPEIELHLIGPLQSNKAGDAVALFDVIHTLDREKIARAIAREMDKQGKTPRLLVQVNTGEEPQKAGVKPLELADFIAFCRDDLALSIAGLMCIPPIDEEPALHFALLKKYADELGLSELSMGMSADFETAITLGATYVRIGTAIFGGRDYG